MDFKINTYQFGERPEVTKPNIEFYKALGDEGIRNMVSKHYDLLRKSEIKSLFPSDNEAFEASKSHSADFMIQICGGPDYFNQNRGKPMLANRHAPFAITPEVRVVWLLCYKEVLEALAIPKELTLSFWNYLEVFSNWMVNSKPDTTH